jgi:hypothetical protein
VQAAGMKSSAPRGGCCGGGGVVGKPLVRQAPPGAVWERHDVDARAGAGRLMQVHRHGSTAAGPWAMAGSSAGSGDRMAVARPQTASGNERMGMTYSRSYDTIGKYVYLCSTGTNILIFI